MPRKNQITSLKKRAEFLAVAASGRKWVAPGLILQIGKPREAAAAVLNVEISETPRHGLTASGKVGNAVVRNRARRRLRALVREVLQAHALPDRDYVLIARAGTATRTYADLRQDLINGLKRLGVWREGL